MISGNSLDSKLEETLKQSGLEGLIKWLQNDY